MRLRSAPMRQRGSAVPLIVAALLAALPAIGRACGACDEDRIAATYDHKVVQRAAAVGDVMVVCEIVGRFDAARLRSIAAGLPGVRPGTVRLSTEFAALSFAVDPKRGSALAAVQAARHAIGPAANLKIVRPTPAPLAAGSP